MLNNWFHVFYGSQFGCAGWVVILSKYCLDVCVFLERRQWDFVGWLSLVDGMIKSSDVRMQFLVGWRVISALWQTIEETIALYFGKSSFAPCFLSFFYLFIFFLRLENQTIKAYQMRISMLKLIHLISTGCNGSRGDSLFLLNIMISLFLLNIMFAIMLFYFC